VFALVCESKINLMMFWGKALARSKHSDQEGGRFYQGYERLSMPEGQ